MGEEQLQVGRDEATELVVTLLRDRRKLLTLLLAPLLLLFLRALHLSVNTFTGTRVAMVWIRDAVTFFLGFALCLL